MAGFIKKSMDELNRADSSLHKNSRHFPITILLDNVRSMHNVGSVFRTGDAFNVEKVILCGITPTPPHRDIQKTALGATESVSWAYAASAIQTIEYYKSRQYSIVGIEQVHNAVFLQEWLDRPEKMLLIFGNEVDGISDDILALCDACIEIPQLGSKHSLNISVSTGIILWEVLRDRF